MRSLLHALIVTTIALAVLASAARAEPLSGSPAAADTSQQHAGLFATVVRDHGAAVRVAPSSAAPIMFNTMCGDVWPALATEGGWVKVRTDTGVGWVGGGRVIVSSSPAAVDCSDARFIFPTGHVQTYVASGCLSLRATPSREGAILACVQNGHRYLVVDGPYDPGTGEDWFKVTSGATGSGWALADHLYR